MKEMRIVIVEDEAMTARNLAHILKGMDSTIRIVELLNSVNSAAVWFNNNEDVYDLIFMDIRLADGLSFDIFKKAEITRPVIFVTAYNDYALQAFKNNGIDYILKPFDEQEITNSLHKFNSLLTPPSAATDNSQLGQILEQFVKSYKKSFLLHFRDKLIPVEAAKIAWFYTANEIVYARLIDDRQFIMEFSMEQLEQQLDPEIFFRANRQFIINRIPITEVEFYFNGRLMIKIKPEPAERILISKARVHEFKIWMNR